MLEGNEIRVVLNTPPRLYHCAPEWSWKSPKLRDHDFWCVIRGIGRLALGRSDYVLMPGTCFLLVPGDQVEATHDPSRPLVVFSYHFSLPNEEVLPPVRGRIVRDLSWLEAVARRAVKVARGRWDSAPGDVSDGLIPVWRMQVEACLKQIGYLLYTEEDGPEGESTNPRIEALMERIFEEPGADWRVEIMAREAGYSRTHFSRIFRQYAGETPKRYLIAMRIQRAAELLRETTLQVQEIADQLGYQDVYFFSRQFKREMGASPTGYRKQTEG